ncbi:MAG: hypothetical protein ACJ76F_01655 [Bacteroidia bacterium]
MSVLCNSCVLFAQAGDTTKPSQKVIKDFIDPSIKVIDPSANEEVYKVIKPNTLITTKEYEILLEEKKKTSAHSDEPK